MTINKLFSTLYVFQKNLIAILKIRKDGTLKVLECSIEQDELKEFLQSKGYVIS